MNIKKYLGITFSSLLIVSATLPNVANAEEVYVLRGFTNMFSLGMNVIGEKLVQKGVRATVHSNGEWSNIAKNITSRSRRNQVSFPIIIMGHSLGGVEAASFANELASNGIPVHMVIGVDPGFPTPPALGPKISKVLNIKLPAGHDYVPGNGFKGMIRMVDARKFEVTHTSIDDSPEVQDLIVNTVLQATR